MKNIYRFIPLPLLALAPLAHAQEVDIEGASGFIAPLTISLTLSETTGGYAISAAKKETEAAKGVTYPDFATYQTIFQSDSPLSAIVNPYDWNTEAGNNYVEKVTVKTSNSGETVRTASGSFKITKNRYTNATLLADLAAAGTIPATSGYRLVAVRFNVSGDSHYDTPTHVTDVNTGYYFFAEKGPNDPSPIYLGAERNDMLEEERFIAFTRSTTAKSGAYVDVFTESANTEGVDYTLKSESYSGTALADFAFYRPAEDERFYVIVADGLFSWSERFDTRRQVMAPGTFSGSSLAGWAQLHTHSDEAGYVPAPGGQAVVGGSVKFGRSTFAESMTKYLDSLPPTMETHED